MFCGVHVALSLVFCVVFCRSMFVFFCIFVLFFYFIFGPSSIYGFCYLQAVFIDAIYDADEKGIFINKMDSIVPVKCMVALFFDCLV
jgi:hypothetical protein